MSAETLRRAAALMRERAEAANPGHPWYDRGDLEEALSPFTDTGDNPRADAEHIASWRPAVAQAVARLLDNQAALIEEHGGFFEIENMGDASALDVARTYLEETQ